MKATVGRIDVSLLQGQKKKNGMNAEKLCARLIARLKAALQAFGQANDCEAILLGLEAPQFEDGKSNAIITIELREKKTEP